MLTCFPITGLAVGLAAGLGIGATTGSLAGQERGPAAVSAQGSWADQRPRLSRAPQPDHLTVLPGRPERATRSRARAAVPDGVTRAMRVPASVAVLGWDALAKCESGGDPDAVSPVGYLGLYQFDRQTWHAVGGSGSPLEAGAAEQTYRAQLLYMRRGTAPWPSCGHHL